MTPPEETCWYCGKKLPCNCACATNDERKDKSSPAQTFANALAEKLLPCWQPSIKECACPAHVLRPQFAAALEAEYRKGFEEATIAVTKAHLKRGGGR